VPDVSSNLPEELPANFEFGGYIIRACIGRGGMARVYRAEQAALHRPVALKVLDRWVLEKPQGAQRFLREARAAASIKHPNVVDIVDVGVWQERPYIVMELLNGNDLETHLAQYGVLSDTAVANLALPIIAGMMAVHDAGVVHRDLKPSNIFLANGPDGDVTPKVLDFGVSKFNDKLHEPIKGQTKTREIIGTPTYMAPEALNGVRELGPRADQYALGAVLYECAVGRPPFEGETLLELLKAIAVGNIPAPRSVRPEISITLEDAILRAMNGNPKARFDTLRDFGRALWPMADDRSRTIWSRSFGNGRATTFGGGETAGLVLVARERMVEPKPPSASSWPSLRKLSWVGLFLAAGALAAVVVLGPWRELRRSAHQDTSAAAVPIAAAPGVERRSLMAEAARAAPGLDSTPSVSPPSGVPSSGMALGEKAQSSPTSRAPAPGASTTVTGADTRLDSRALAARGANSPRATRALPAANKRRRSSRSEFVEASGDSDLDGLFTAPGLLEQPGSAAGARELDGLFPMDEQATLGANGSPLPD
jgi:eukaryotic-like serine/threonine-protein kinase